MTEELKVGKGRQLLGGLGKSSLQFARSLSKVGQ